MSVSGVSIYLVDGQLGLTLARHGPRRCDRVVSVATLLVESEKVALAD